MRMRFEGGTYPGIPLSFSNCSKIKRMHVCLKDMALKASESSYMLETFSNDISWQKFRVNIYIIYMYNS